STETTAELYRNSSARAPLALAPGRKEHRLNYFPGSQDAPSPRLRKLAPFLDGDADQLRKAGIVLWNLAILAIVNCDVGERAALCGREVCAVKGPDWIEFVHAASLLTPGAGKTCLNPPMRGSSTAAVSAGRSRRTPPHMRPWPSCGSSCRTASHPCAQRATSTDISRQVRSRPPCGCRNRVLNHAKPDSF